MANNEKDNHLTRVIRKLAFLWGTTPLFLVWSIGVLALGALFWGATLSKLDAEKGALEKNALKEASTLSSGYAQQLTRAIEQVDQITLLVKHDWEHSHGALKLEDLLRKGPFAVPRLVSVAIIDRNGMPTMATIPIGNHLRTAVDRDYFLFQKNDTSNSLFIGKPVIGRVSGKTVIHFVRRLDAADGAFDGVVLVSVEPTYFSSFYDGPSLGEAGLLAMVGRDGALRASRIGGTIPAPATPALRAIPAFDSAEGAVFLTGPWFADHQARFIGWSTLKTYPFVAMVGLSADEVLAPYRFKYFPRVRYFDK